jgi:predicted nucleic acid-binding protein
MPFVIRGIFSVMSDFVDTSYLCALYFPREQAASANEYFERVGQQLLLNSLVQFEFRHAISLAIFRHERGNASGIPSDTAMAGLTAFELDLEGGRFASIAIDLDELVIEALRLCEVYTLREALRSMDTLHLAAAKVLGCTDFLTFDKLQRRVAELEGFSVPV